MARCVNITDEIQPSTCQFATPCGFPCWFLKEGPASLKCVKKCDVWGERHRAVVTWGPDYMVTTTRPPPGCRWTHVVALQQPTQILWMVYLPYPVCQRRPSPSRWSATSLVLPIWATWFLPSHKSWNPVKILVLNTAPPSSVTLLGYWVIAVIGIWQENVMNTRHHGCCKMLGLFPWDEDNKAHKVVDV